MVWAPVTYSATRYDKEVKILFFSFVISIVFHVRIGKWLVIQGLLVICRGTVNFNVSNSTNVHEGTQENPVCLMLSFSLVKSSGLKLPHLLSFLDLFSCD